MSFARFLLKRFVACVGVGRSLSATLAASQPDHRLLLPVDTTAVVMTSGLLGRSQLFQTGATHYRRKAIYHQLFTKSVVLHITGRIWQVMRP
jgi:hypothetical protein